MKIIWSILALNDLKRVVEQAAEQDWEWADAILAETQRIEMIVSRHPRIGPALAGSTHRKLRLGALPFVLVYQVDSSGIGIIRLHHSASDWRS